MQYQYINVAGVTFENRQALIENMSGDEIVILSPEPDNPYDKNAIAVHIINDTGEHQIGYLPRFFSEQFRDIVLDPHSEIAIAEITGGFTKYDGSQASYGVRLVIGYETDGNNELPF